MNAKRGFYGIVLFAIIVGSLGCGGTSAPPASSSGLHGDVLERAEGFSNRPDWADPQGSWSRNGDKLSVSGYVAITPEQRLDMGYRIADSYARAELLRFVSSRVLAVLEDKQTWAGDQKLRERIEDTASAVVDDWVVAARYWEKRKDGTDVRVHVFSRLEVDQTGVAELLRKATAGATDLRVSQGELLARLSATWGRLSDVEQLSSETMPGGVQAPSWASAGDAETPEEFSFVCQAVDADETRAKALAQARCNEKLCRLFGVQITARTRVTETLEGVDAESEVTEQCADVRAVGRRTTNRGGECGSSGCVAWVRHSYPRSAYEAEKERLAAPTVIEHQVVIQEGDKHYRDPKACESALTSYGTLHTLSASDFLERRKLLRSALASCQGIDDRDSGLFQSINTRLLAPIDYFIFTEAESWQGPDTFRVNFVHAPPGWRGQYDSQRFLTDRIQMILKIVEDAVLPMQLADLVSRRLLIRPRSFGTEQPETDALIVELLKKPFTAKATSPSHTTTVHSWMLNPMYGGIPSKRYRAFLLERLVESERTCDKPDISGGDIATYLLLDKELDDKEWSAIVPMLERAPSNHIDSCVFGLIPASTPPAVAAARGQQIATLIARGQIRRASAKDESLQLFERWLNALPEAIRFSVYQRSRQDLRGSDSAKKDLALVVLFSVTGQKIRNSYLNNEADSFELAQCEELPAKLTPAVAAIPELPLEKSRLCPCLALKELSTTTRDALVKLFLDHSDLRCKFMTDKEWPGGAMTWPYAKRRWGTEDSPLVRFNQVLAKEYSDCAYGTTLHNLRFTPMLQATLRDGRLRDVTVTTQIGGTLRDLTFREGPDRFVRKADVEAATRQFNACFLKATEGYEVPAKALRTPNTAPRKIWIEMGDQGTSDGFGS